MSPKLLRILSLLAVMAAGGLAFGATPAFACHQATGWCCVEGANGHPYCCYFDNNQVVEPTCGPV